MQILQLNRPRNGQQTGEDAGDHHASNPSTARTQTEPPRQGGCGGSRPSCTTDGGGRGAVSPLNPHPPPRCTPGTETATLVAGVDAAVNARWSTQCALGQRSGGHAQAAAGPWTQRVTLEMLTNQRQLRPLNSKGLFPSIGITRCNANGGEGSHKTPVK